MNYDINRISSEYAKKGREELYAIKAFFEKNGIAVLETTPTQIRFVPWKADSAVLKKEMYGILTWNPINQMIIIEYHCHFPYQGSTDQYSLILKWYLLKWNERYGNRFHKTAIKFIYPGQENSELILQASCKAARHTLDDLIARNIKLFESFPENYKRQRSEGKTALPKCLTNYVPRRPEIGLVGRDSVVQKVRAMLDDTELFVLVSGLGGIGKTAVMQEICNDILEDGISKNHVAWITCGDSLEDDLLALRDPLGVPKGLGMEKAYKAAIGELQSFDGTLYLFMDDMARMPDGRELGILNSLRPNVHIMITSRHEIGRVRKIDLTELEQDSAIKMFYGYYEYDKEAKYREDARIIVESVNRHTFLVELLAKAANRSFDTLDVFRRELEEKGFFEVSGARLTSAHDENLTIEESVRKLYGISELSPEQERIMSLFTIFTPEKVIYGKAVEWAGFDENDVEGLVRLGWLARTEGGYVIHQIVRDSLAVQAGDGLKIEEYGVLLEKVADTDSYMPKKLEYTKIRERLVLAEDVARHLNKRTEKLLSASEHTEGNPEFLRNSATLLNNLGGVYEAQGEYEKALENYRKALSIKERVLGKNHPATAATYNNMGGVYRAKGEYEKALEYYGKALEIFERVLGKDHPDTATTYNNIALVFDAQGEYQKALEYYRNALSIRECVLGKDHLSTATTYNNMALVFRAQGEYENALEYFRKAFLIVERELGKDHPLTATMYNNMGGVYRVLGDYEKALEYYGNALSIRERVLGKDHPETVSTYNNMGVAYQKQGKYEKALKFFENALEIYERILGKDHPEIAKTYNNMALVFEKQGEYEKAREYYGNALEIYERVLGKDHPSTATIYNNIGGVYRAKSEYKTALEYYGNALSIKEKVLGKDHPSTATTYNNMGGVYRAQGDYKKALEYYENALSVFKVIFGENHPTTKDTQVSVLKMKNIIKSGVGEDQLIGGHLTPEVK